MRATYNLKKLILVGSASAFAVLASPLVSDYVTGGMSPIVATAQAAEDHADSGHSGGHGGGHAGTVTGGKQYKGGQAGGSGMRGGNKSIDKLLSEADEDSDRPVWAGGAKELNPHRGEGSAGSDIKKGSDFGDIWVILRDDLGNPILDANGNIQPCLDAGCTRVIQLTADGELPIEYTDQVIAVEFGRLNIARAPNSVLEHSLVEALTKLDDQVWGVDVTLDASGRLVIDGVAIDSPLENLALYEALLTSPVVDGMVVLSVTTNLEGGGTTTLTFSVPESMRLDLAASAIAAASDKTGDLNVDEIVNISKFLDVDDELATLVGSYTYDRLDTYGEVTVWVLVPTVVPTPDPADDPAATTTVYVPTEVHVLDTVTFNTVPTIAADSDGIDRFAQAADDSVQVLEYVHDNALDQ
jgi:hypothetical protein